MGQTFSQGLLLLSFMLTTVGLVGCSSSGEATPTTASTATTGPRPETSVAAAVTTTSVPTTTTSVENAPPIIRPYLDPAVCGAGAGNETDFQDYTWYPFAVTREAPIPLQVIAEPVDGVTRPFAVAVRLFHADREFPSDQVVVINGARVSISVASNGNGQAAWALSDASTAYVRSRDLDLAELSALVSRLTPRESAAAIPGFDYQRDPSDPDGPRLLYEHLNTGLAGTIKTFQCETGGGNHIYRISVIGGDPVFVYFGIIDAPRPYAVGSNGSGAITIYGLQDPAAPTLQQVTEADAAVWAGLPYIS
jgi:hypothetical protein